MPLTALDIESNLLMEFLRKTNTVDYVAHFNLAKALLKNKTDRLAEIEGFKKEVEDKYHTPLYKLQMMYLSTWDLSKYFRPNRKKMDASSKVKVRMWEVKQSLDDFRNRMDTVVLDEFTKGRLEF